MNFKTTVEREKAEEYVRKQIPELMELSFGCTISNSKNYPLVYVGYNNGQHALSLTVAGEKSMLFVDRVYKSKSYIHSDI